MYDLFKKRIVRKPHWTRVREGNKDYSLSFWMPRCKKCGKSFPFLMAIDGRLRNLCSRSFCLTCSPFGKHNTQDLTKPVVDRKAFEVSKTCSRCHKSSPEISFYNSTRFRYCKTCANVKKYQRDVGMKKRAIEYKGGKCIRCGYVGHPVVYDFHHLHDKQMSWRMMCNSGWEKAQIELDKCELLCSNCHRLLHAKHRD
jgi:hypothetical protein